MSDESTMIDLKAWNGRFVSQQEANYTPLSSTPGQACANCRWFSVYNRCFIVENDPQPILATGHSNRWEPTPQPTELDTEPIPVVIVEQPYDYEDSQEMALTVPKNLVERVKEFIAGIRPRATPEPAVFTVYKAANGRKAWISRHTGKWVDREDEILSEKSHESYVERVQKGIVSPPELWMWHAKGTRHGQAVTVWKSGGFVLAAGYFDETPAGEKAFAYYEKNAGKIKLSHMFHFPRQTKIGGVYNEYNTVEITTLPDGAEAFPYTSFQEIKTMPISSEAARMIEEALGADVLQAAQQADNKAGEDTKKLDALGVASKNYDQYDGSELLKAAKTIEEMVNKANGEFDTRLKTVEDSLTELPQSLKGLTDLINSLNDKVEKSQQAVTAVLEKNNQLETKLAELTDLQPPASKSDNTLLGQREKTLVDNVMAAAKADDSVSYIEKLLGSQPTITTTP
jgi:hypothetical protein